MSTAEITNPSAAAVDGSNKRRKVTRACDRCKARKRRCDGAQPCSLCTVGQQQCYYATPYKRGRISRVRDSSATQAFNDQQVMHPYSENLPAGNAVNDEASANWVSRTSRAVSPFGDDAQLGQYSGPTSTFSFLRRAFHRFGRRTSQASRDLPPAEETSVFEYGDIKPHQIPHDAIDALSETKVNRLIGVYFDLAAPTHRFLHKPTVERWALSYLPDDYIISDSNQLIRKAVVYLVLATALLYDGDNVAGAVESSGVSEATPNSREMYFKKAHDILTKESGAPKLESVQARIATVLYLLHTSRLNQAWYTLGVTYQLIVAQGLHLARSSTTVSTDRIVQESKKRCYWVAYTVDTYLSIMLGRPPLVSEQGVDQTYPELVNDENLNLAGISSDRVARDCVEAGPVFHAKLARILRVALAQQYTIQGGSAEQQIDLAHRLNTEIDNWEHELPAHLNGGIHPSSLVPVFQRQLRVLQMGACHAAMIINRPIMILKNAPVDNTQPCIQRCKHAARKVIDIVIDLIEEHHKLAAFWYFQHITFHALAVVYVWIISSKQHYASYVQPQHDDRRLFELAAKIQPHLSEATRLNAPSLRYGIILDELQEESNRVLGGHAKETVAQPDGPTNTARTLDAVPADVALDWDSSIDFSIDLEFWNQLDNLAFEGGIDLFPANSFENL